MNQNSLSTPLSTPRRVTNSQLQTPTPGSQTTGRRTPRRPALKDGDKVEVILTAIKDVGWTISKFLDVLFEHEDLKFAKHNAADDPSLKSQHRNMVQAFLNGTAKPHAGYILDRIYQYAGNLAYRSNDATFSAQLYVPGRSFKTVEHARPSLVAWAVSLVSELVRAEADKMIQPETGLHMRAKSKRREHQVTWSAVDAFSFRTLQNVAETHAPIFWTVTSSYANSTFIPGGELTAIRKQRPQNLVTTSAVMSLTFCRSQLASLYPMCRGIWHFAARSHQNVFRVESRIGHAVAYKTVFDALKTMANDQLQVLKDTLDPASGRHGVMVSDNVQEYAVQRDHRIGRENRMIKGMAATVVLMEDVVPGAFNLKELVQRQALQERKTLTREMIFNDIDWTHQESVATPDFLRTLIHFVPVLSDYRDRLKAHSDEQLRKFPLPKTRRTKIFPLGTNSFDELHSQEMKEAVLDFVTQMGVNAENLNGRCIVALGDGKTFDQLIKIRKLMVAEEGDFESFRWMIPLLELWHTKWTDLSRTVRGHWGEGHSDDPSTLACWAKVASCPTPSNLRKVEFFDGAHLVNLALDANILSCWELHYGTSDLTAFFEEKQSLNTLPEFEELIQTARKLARRHATTKAVRSAHNPSKKNPDQVPKGSPWVRKRTVSSTAKDTATTPSEKGSPDLVPDMFDEKHALTSPDADVTLANATLFIRNAIWWREMCRAVVEGDTGRVWEILKIWIFTSAGSGNPYYSQYLLELFCNHAWEWDDPTRQSIMANWLVSLYELGQFSEMDLMQETHNRFLEEHAQHKGKEFDDPFYRKVISMNVHHFARLKDEMEEAVLLKMRTKKHSVTDLANELKALLKLLREAEVHRFRAGRNEGFMAWDDFERGYEILLEKIKRFIEKSTAFSDILGEHDTLHEMPPMEGDLDARPLPARLHLVDDELYIGGGSARK
ncbi:hypothetical protein FPV67DRAFT_1411833 [Lyophyllum atratum]|nr:hypothetical protein FPV67DRAFT_1411833 [Lyophyllum atratum]